ncbi:bacteriorhodopsin [Psychrobacter sp. PL15]|uniref:bacteriorhodopsin-like n=1 Tax=unclassified Psychrobacter TaxID=196806 RepID=UPI001AE5A3EA|nr:bacteriorhodopsin-like [Psychrobacter sp. PL15]MEC5209224.1 bacteriorhodopsin [Psychrobacter sp. PL15]
MTTKNAHNETKSFSLSQVSVNLKMIFTVLFLSLLPSFANAAANLAADDFVGISFWLISMALMAATVFFLWETQSVTAKWKTSLVVSGLVTFIAAVHYFYMRDVWIATQSTPTVYRYIDWLLTVPLLMIEFYLILRAIGVAKAGIFWRLLIGTLVMLIPGYMAEAGFLNITVGFIIGMLGWFYILYEIFFGEAGKAAEREASPAVKYAYKAMRWIVTVGWAIYPIGFVLGYMTGTADQDALNIVYNFADLVNKVAFGLLIWYAATSESQGVAEKHV